jgi:hypothetical protein
MPTAYLSPSQLKELTDVSVSPGVAVDDYPLTYDHGLGKWVASNNIAGVTVRAGAGANSQAIGSTANSSGNFWIAQGVNAGASNTTGEGWIAQGFQSGASNTTGGYWIAQGRSAGFSSSTGNFWIAQGFQSGASNTTGENWIAQGVNAGASNTTGGYWIAQGRSAGLSSSTGNFWIAQGFNAGASNTTGEGWIAQGVNAGASNTTGSYWIAQGYDAGYYDTRSDVLNIANGRSKSLICGNFANDCIYFGHVGPITSSANVPVPTAAVHTAASNTTRASLRIDAGVAPTSPFIGDVWMNVSNNSLTLNFPLLNLGNKQVLTTTRTGWTAPTGTSARGTFDTATVTLEELAQRLKALIDDLTTHGLIGA